MHDFRRDPLRYSFLYAGKHVRTINDNCSRQAIRSKKKYLSRIELQIIFFYRVSCSSPADLKKNYSHTFLKKIFPKGKPYNHFEQAVWIKKNYFSQMILQTSFFSDLEYC